MSYDDYGLPELGGVHLAFQASNEASREAEKQNEDLVICSDDRTDEKTTVAGLNLGSQVGESSRSGGEWLIDGSLVLADLALLADIQESLSAGLALEYEAGVTTIFEAPAQMSLITRHAQVSAGFPDGSSSRLRREKSADPESRHPRTCHLLGRRLDPLPARPHVDIYLLSTFMPAISRSAGRKRTSYLAGLELEQWARATFVILASTVREVPDAPTTTTNRKWTGNCQLLWSATHPKTENWSDSGGSNHGSAGYHRSSDRRLKTRSPREQEVGDQSIRQSHHDRVGISGLGNSACGAPGKALTAAEHVALKVLL
ncbi:hypothetical protein B0T19DRAFT_398553 [Cercophora scortea]|uniref:Uncharacterized protein n=1 Tax=Cercophora scortea TaxID=314031 RepID=A0AAE0IWZ8_9PEZI|nr:hypothetical protein B0T19DRAFT_398553 [Cercophora scortea]